MKQIILIFFLIALHLLSYSQDTIKENVTQNKSQLLVKLGGSYKSFIGNKYIERQKNVNNNYQLHQYEGFTKVPTFGYQAGVVWSYKLSKTFHMALGLSYYLRKETYQGNRDTVLKYHTPTSIHDILKYEYSYNDIELPILFSLNFKKINFYLGVYIPLVTFYKAVYTYIPNSTDDITSKTITSIELSKNIFPTFQISYNLKIKKYLFNPFLGIDFDFKENIYYQGGIIVPITNNILHNKQIK